MKMSRPGSGQHTTLLSDPAFTGEVYEVSGYRAYALSRRRGTQGEAGAGLMAGDYKASGPMLDSRRDCRYRRGVHRSIGVGLGKVTFHDMSGASRGDPRLSSHPYSPECVGGRSAEASFCFPVVGFLPRQFAHGVACLAFRREGRGCYGPALPCMDYSISPSVHILVAD